MHMHGRDGARGYLSSACATNWNELLLRQVRQGVCVYVCGAWCGRVVVASLPRHGEGATTSDEESKTNNGRFHTFVER